MLHGTEEQKAEHLPPMLRGEVAWCQGFSEPGSGSDLASLQTRAVRDGDDYVVNGQKIWTSGAHRADWMFMMARTDPDAPKHRGISYLLLSMKSPGVTVRPLINMAGGHVFNEVFFEDVRVPVRNRIGEENRGWYVGTTTLDFERSNIARAISARKSVEKLVRYKRDRDATGQSLSPMYRLEIADRGIETAVCEMFSFVVISIQARGGVPNMEASMCKMYGSELSQRIAWTSMHVTGMDGQRRQPDALAGKHGIQASAAYMSTVPATIAAGTSEIQRNIIATRGLGLPRG
jgi:alkylation response protein AidB-like acyl-CoA dehydrogenase